jgi:hypothetical protein
MSIIQSVPNYVYIGELAYAFIIIVIFGNNNNDER